MTDKNDVKTRLEKKGVAQTVLSGSESIARAVIDAGTRVAASYPGGPITGIVEKLIEQAAASDLYVEWSNCEKVAFEVALGCSPAGRRAVIAAKHVGINHILDPLMTVNLTGFQDRTGAGTTAMGEAVRAIYPEKVAEAMGIDNVRTLDAFDEAAIRKTLQEVFSRKGLSFLVVRGRCPFIESKKCRATAEHLE